MNVSWVSHKGTQILYIDYRGAKTTEEMIATLERGVQALLASSKPVPVLSNYMDAPASSEFMTKVKETGTLNKGRSCKMAVTGIDGIKAILVRAYIRVTGGQLQVCATEAEALDYLAA
jgi:hypothetical protein